MIKHQKDNSKSNYNYNAYTYVNHGWQPHFHKNFELIFILDGELRLTVNGESSIMSEGELALILPNQIHFFEPNGRSNIWVAVFSEQFVSYFARQTEGLEGERSVFRCDDATLEFIKEKLIFADSSLIMKKACLYTVCDRFLASVALHPRKRGNDDLVCHILDYVSEHFTEPLTLSSVAKELGYEYHYLSRVLGKGYGINFSGLVNEYRVDRAISLLESTDKPITDIALESGFQSIRNFNHVFRAVTGTTPKSYIKG